MLFRNIVRFGRLLRRVGLDVHTGRLQDAMRGIEHVGIASREDVRHTLRTLLVHRHEDLERFDRAFDLFWRRHDGTAPLSELHALGERPRRVAVRSAGHSFEAIVSDSGAAADSAEERRQAAVRTYSAQELWRAKDFARFTAEEIEEARAFLRGLTWSVGQRRTRRWVSGRGRALDLRRLVGRNMKHDGELLHLPRRRRKHKMRPLVLICDVSGSMERYSRMLLHFVYALARGPARVDAFLFATRLTRVTPHLRRDRADDVVAAIARAVPDWSGGTRIGEALKTFNRRWGRRVLGHGPVVLLISDGWDRGEPELLRREIARLQRSCHRLIWLNPLLGLPRYEPLTRGMQTALRHVDDFLPANNLASLEALADYLNRLAPARPARRQDREFAAPWT